ncbi:MAG TPA: cytochrome c oxidase subunit II [Fibrobacteres bacterium]|jgi:cytochrome c oxidase subunit 2|nr:cytochrome c oxidase subunit II [Fibrobacterota bacterium]
MDTTKSFWLPEKASTFADAVDFGFNLYYWISVFFFVLIVFLMAWFVVRYIRRRPDQLASAQITHNTLLETTWTAIPLLIVMGLFVLGMKGYWNMRVAPSNAMQIDVTGRKWAWSFDYPKEGISNDTLVVPVHQPIRLRMTSVDVIHSFFIPAFRTKADVIPGRYHSLWFEATKTGVFQVFCTQYCGTNHSYMWTAVKVVTAEEYAAWLEAASDPSKGKTPEEFGEILYSKKGCVACHSVDGSVGIGPTWKGIWGTEVPLEGGGEAIVNEAYAKQSMMEPASQVVKGFQPIMPPFQGVLSDKEVDALTAYIRSLK